MPARLQAFHECLAVISTAIGTAITAIVAAMPDVQAAAFNGPAIYDDERLRLICIVGALGGAVFNLGLYSEPKPGIRPMAWKVFCSAMAGVAFTPIAIHWLGVVPNIDNLLAASFVMAIVSVGALKMVVPAWTRFLGTKLGADSAAAPPSSSDQTNQSPKPS
jgi:hypothetical protein